MNEVPNAGVTRTLARYVADAQPADIPDAVTHEARRALLHWLGCSLGGCRHEAVEAALATFGEFSRPREATVLGRAERVDVLLAALLNGISADVLGFSDTHLKTVIHAGGVIGPAVTCACRAHAGFRQGLFCTRSCSALKSPAASASPFIRGITRAAGTSRARPVLSAPLRPRASCWGWIRATHDMGARHRGDAGRWLARNVRQHVQEPARRARGTERLERSTARAQRFYQLRVRD
jgi:hypothetical protein